MARDLSEVFAEHAGISGLTKAEAEQALARRGPLDRMLFESRRDGSGNLAGGDRSPCRSPGKRRWRGQASSPCRCCRRPARRARHGSLRAFSIAHFAHSKERDDAAALLADAGVPEEVAAALGIRRSPRIGVADAIDAIVRGQKTPAWPRR
jgi:hypothetical protein